MSQILGIAEARAALPSIVDRFSNGQAEGVVIGSHRKPEAAIVPYAVYVQLKPALPAGLAAVRQRADLVRRLASLSGIRGVSVFGSVARGDEHADSDIDFLVETTAEASLFDLARFERDMEQLFLRSVDVVTRASLDERRDKRILAEAVAL